MKGVLITMMGSKTTVGGDTYEKGFTLRLPADDPQVKLFRQRPCFKFKDLFMPDPPTSEVIKVEIPEGHTPITDVEGIDPKVAEILAEGGFVSAEMILSDKVKHEDLTKLKGIGSATADKIIELCEVALAKKDDGGEKE